MMMGLSCWRKRIMTLKMEEEEEKKNLEEEED